MGERSAIRIDHPSVSRQHARLQLTPVLVTVMQGVLTLTEVTP